MKEISVFDVIGPLMIGPSSSHTAGALRIALVAGKLATTEIKEVTFILYGSFAKTYKGHGTDKALVAGILGMNEQDERIKDAFHYAKERGLSYTFKISEERNIHHPNTVEIVLTDRAGVTVSVMGSSIGGGRITIDKVNGMEVYFTGEYYTLCITHIDRPGVVAHITKCLSECDINIAFMRLYRTSKGEIANTIIEADEPIDEKVITKMMVNSFIKYAKIIEL